ncbi:related to senescence marker protein 30 [Rhynchosporium agropyri]|uniref:Related to senescence marker protein 30 n=1 Tax=Rhynchosporium agropyri TaxID=914238 RepID=A0A1E1K6X3_9HELO|nr:related to senescence marker protein 30 [Rhynchosporium agropyri]
MAISIIKGSRPFLSWWHWVVTFFFRTNSAAIMPASSYQRWTVTEPYLDLHCALGEGPYYEEATNSLRFVDIIKRHLHTVDLGVGPKSLKTLQFDMPVGVTADIEGVDPKEKILIGGKSGVYVLERETGKCELLKRFEDSEEKDDRMRSNDGAIDPQGRFWVGTMNDFHVGEPQPEGSLYRFKSDLTRKTLRSSLTIPNSIGWSPDHKTLYFVHSTEKRIIAFDFDNSTGDITNERVFWQHDGQGDPDGFKIDTEGNIWQAMYGESRVLKISPEGKVVGEITYPTKCITCPVFVGTEIWVTTADDHDASRPYAGAVFKVDVGAKGLKEFKFKLDKGISGLLV